MVFKLSEDEVVKYNKFRDSHKCSVDSVGTIGGKYTFSFTPTGLGVITRVQCACGKSIDLTDYEHW